MGDVDDGEQHRAQPERVALPRRPLLDPPVGQRDAARAEAVRLHRPPGVHGLGERGGHRRVSRRLRAVGGRGPAEVPAAPGHQQRHRDQHRGCQLGRRDDQAPSSRAAHTTPIASCGTASRIAFPSRSMSVVIRDSRSPVPARSSTPGGSPTDRTRKSSRRSASIRSPSIAPAAAPAARKPPGRPARPRTARRSAPGATPARRPRPAPRVRPGDTGRPWRRSRPPCSRRSAA